MNFSRFQKDLKSSFAIYIKSSKIYQTNADPDRLWEIYQESFPEGTNEIYRERREHDCSCCKQFIRQAGGMVFILNNEMYSLWDTVTDEPYATVAKALADYVRSCKIINKYTHESTSVGTIKNFESLALGQVQTWNHFHLDLPNEVKYKDAGPFLSETRANFDVLYRGLTELSLDAMETVLELINANALYRGEENKSNLTKYITMKKEFDKVENKELYCWTRDSRLARFRNTALGTLLIDLSDGTELEDAVRKYEAVVAPSNYKRSSALITPAMIKNAQKKVKELGLDGALERRFANIDDITINNILWANRDAKAKLTGDAFADLIEEVERKKVSKRKTQEISIDAFINDVMPNAERIEMFVGNSNQKNLVSLIAPVNADAHNLFKWDNNFSWSYNGDITDSMKDRVKAKGGNVSGVLRYSIQWNDNGDNNIDFDAHCQEPYEYINFERKGRKFLSSGMLDVDIISPRSEIAVENIVYTNKDDMPVGNYEFILHNYSAMQSQAGFTAEIEFDSNIHSYCYDKKLRGKEKIPVATVNKNIKGEFTLTSHLPDGSASKEIWNIETEAYEDVSVIMQSPNHWDKNKTGNRHWFFMLKNCKNPESTRGFYNEFLNGELTEHRKVFEVLASKMKTEPSDNQLSGLGFSSTQHESFTCRVTGSSTITYKVTI